MARWLDGSMARWCLMDHLRFRRLLVALVVVCATEPAVCQSDVGTLRWWKHAWREATEWSPSEPFLITYESRVPAAVVRRSLEQWEEALAAGPPEGFESNADMLRERRALVESGQDDVVLWRLWLGKDKHRWTMDRPSTPSQPFSDHGYSGTLAWTLQEIGGHHWLSVLTPSSVSEVGETASLAGASDRPRKYLLFGGIGLGSGQPASPVPSNASRLSDGSWAAEAAVRYGSGEWIWKYTGQTDTAPGRALPEAIEVLQLSPTVEGQGGARFADWQYNEVAGTWIAHSVDILDAAGGVRARWRVLSVEPVAHESLEELTRVPERGGVDALRGELRVASLTDYRPEVRQATQVMPDGSERTWSIGGRKRPGDRAWLRAAGWMILSLFSGMIVLLVWRRYRTGA